jgi:copper chaperone
MNKAMIEGMNCNNCIGHVTKSLTDLGFKDITINLEGKFATWESDTVDFDVVKEALRNSGGHGYNMTEILTI